MSSSNKEKEEKEYASFLEACEYCTLNSVHITTKRIMDFLNGERIVREKNDKPDIITKCKWGNTETIAGIEVFYVDQNSKKKRGHLKSKTKESRVHIREIYEKGHAQRLNGEEVSEENKMDLLRKTVESVQECLNSDYEMLVSSFKHHFDNHAKNVPIYREALSKYANGQKIALAFFIEIETHFHNLFLNYNNQVVKYDSRLMPFFSEIVSIIEQNPNKHLIDYIVFRLLSKAPDESKIVAIRTGRIKQNLNKQGITVFEFMGDDIMKADPKTTKINRDANGDYIVHFGLMQHTAKNYNLITEITQKAQTLKDHRVPFVTSRTIQAMLYASKARTPEEEDILKQEFINKYPVKEIHDDQT